MNRDRAFWVIFIIFSIGTVLVLNAMGVLTGIGVGGSVILTLSFLAVAYLLKRWVEQNW